MQDKAENIPHIVTEESTCNVEYHCKLSTAN